MELVRATSLDQVDGGLAIHGGTEVVPLLRDGILQTDRLVDVRGVVPHGVNGGTIGAGTTLAELEVNAQIPEALREACRLAASPQLRNMGSIGGNLLQSTRCWYWRLQYPCRLHGGDRCHAQEGEHREHAIFANDFCASAHPSDVAAALLALGAQLHTTQRELALDELYRLPTEDDRDLITLAPGELILELELPPGSSSSSYPRSRRASTSRRWTGSAGRSPRSASLQRGRAARPGSRSPESPRSPGCSTARRASRRRLRFPEQPGRSTWPGRSSGGP